MYNFSLLVGKNSPATLEACQELVSSACIIMVAHLISKLYLKNEKFPETPISHNSLPPISLILLSAWYLNIAVSHSNPQLSTAKLQASVLELRRSGTCFEGHTAAHSRKCNQICESDLERQPGATYRTAGNED